MSTLATAQPAPLRRGQTTSAPWRALGWVLFAVVPMGLLFAAIAPAAWSAGAADGGFLCPFLAITGVQCPFCDMTHATFALGQGDLSASLGYHPLGPLVLAMWMWGSSELTRGRPSQLARHRLTPAAILALVAVIWSANLLA